MQENEAQRYVVIKMLITISYNSYLSQNRVFRVNKAGLIQVLNFSIIVGQVFGTIYSEFIL